MMASLSVLRNRRWFPLGILIVGAVLLSGAGRQQTLPLEAPLGSVVPTEIAGYDGEDDWISDAEADLAGFSNYLFRIYDTPVAQPDTRVAGLQGFSLYVGFYDTQAEGKTIHSPKNCLPGAGFEALSSDPVDVRIGERTETVNGYLLQNGNDRFLALYWYQGRGRVAHDEYRVKWNLLVDAALHRRSDEALVRVIVHIPDGMDEEATALAVSVAREVIPNLERALPQ